MNIRIVLKLLSLLLLTISFFLGTALAVAYIYQEPFRNYISFLIPIGIIVVFFGFMFLTFRSKRETAVLSPKSGFLFVTLSWVSAAGFGALPFFISGYIPSYTNAYFEAMSGFTTTGASILTDVEVLPHSILYWRSLTHWLGGMGIVVLTVAIFPLLGFGGLSLMEAEAPGPTVDKITTRAAGTAKILWLIYVGFTVAETVLLVFGGMPLFDSLLHTFGSVATGGFGIKNTSIGYYNSAYIDAVITIFMTISAMNFTLHYKLLTGQLRDVLKDSEMWAYLAIFFGASLIISWDLLDNGLFKSFGESFRFASFQASSLLTTTGYATADYTKWSNLSQFVLYVLLFIGGCAGSTGGGIKVIRIVTLFKMAVTEIKYLVRPKGLFGIFVNGQNVNKNVVYDCAALVVLYFFVFFVVTFIVASGGYDAITSTSATIACLGNVGPGFGPVGPAGNYELFPDYITWALSFAMLVGRLEVYTVLVLFIPAFWKK